MKYYIITFGCQMNKSDSERMTTVLENMSYEKTSKIDGADLLVINMCSVRQSAVDRVYGKIRDFAKLKIKNEKLKIILTGCILNSDKKKLKNKVDLILAIKDLPKLPKFLAINESGSRNKDVDYLKIEPKYQSPFSAFVPIMTGCNNLCTYCVVPYTRGREISRSAEEILGEVKNLVKKGANPIRNAISNGAREIWLLGQNVNSYKDGKINFPKLLKMVNDIPGEFWIRFTSSHPKDFSDELIEVMANCEKVTEYLNLPVQSGDDKILKKMNRPYKIGQYKNLVKKIREKISNITLSTDVIVGFPGETKKNFENTVKLFKEIKYDMAYIAKYSPRPGTAASQLKDNVSQKEKEERWKILTEILKETALEKNKKYIGKKVEVLINSKKDNFYFGKTRTYKTTKIQLYPEPYTLKTNLVGRFVKVKILDTLPWGLKGRLIKNLSLC